MGTEASAKHDAGGGSERMLFMSEGYKLGRPGDAGAGADKTKGTEASAKHDAWGLNQKSVFTEQAISF